MLKFVEELQKTLTMSVAGEVFFVTEIIVNITLGLDV
jgi:hypothetical protein